MQTHSAISQSETTNQVPTVSAWRVSYVYDNPSPAGPFKGRTTVTGDKPTKGNGIYAIFGMATIKSVSRA